MSEKGTVLHTLHISFAAFLELRLLSGAAIGGGGGGVLGSAESDWASAGTMLSHSADGNTMGACEGGVVDASDVSVDGNTMDACEGGVVGASDVAVDGPILLACDDELVLSMLAAEPIGLLPAMSGVGSCPPHEPIYNDRIHHVPITPTQFG